MNGGDGKDGASQVGGEGEMKSFKEGDSRVTDVERNTKSPDGAGALQPDIDCSEEGKLDNKTSDGAGAYLPHTDGPKDGKPDNKTSDGAGAHLPHTDGPKDGKPDNKISDGAGAHPPHTDGPEVAKPDNKTLDGAGAHPPNTDGPEVAQPDNKTLDRAGVHPPHTDDPEEGKPDTKTSDGAGAHLPHTDFPEVGKPDNKTPDGASTLPKDQSHGVEGTRGTQDKTEDYNGESSVTRNDVHQKLSKLSVETKAGAGKDNLTPESPNVFKDWVFVNKESLKEKEHVQQPNISGGEEATLNPTEDQDPESKGKDGTSAEEGQSDQEKKDGETKGKDGRKPNEAKDKKKCPKGKEDKKETNLPLPRKRPVSISLCTSAYDFNVKGIEFYLNGVKKERPELIKEVKIHYLPYNDLDSYRFSPKNPIDVMILCHSINNRRFAITDVMDALYDKYLPYCASVIGKAKMGVIVHDFVDMRDTAHSSRMDSFKSKQPKAFETTNLQITCGHIETEKQVLTEMLEDDRNKLVEFLENASKHSEPMMDLPTEKEETRRGKAKRLLNEAKRRVMSWNTKPNVDDQNIDSRTRNKQREHDNQSIGTNVDTGDEGTDPHDSGLPKKPKYDASANDSASNAKPDSPPKTPHLQQKEECTSHGASTTNSPGSSSQHSMSQSSRNVGTSASQGSSYMTQSNPRPISVSICSSAYKHNVDGLMSWFNDLKTKHSHMIADVRFRELPYNDIDSFTFQPQDPVDVMVLCHSVDNRGFSITDVMNSIYNKYLKYCNDLIGKRKLAVIVHDFKDLNPDTTEVKMESFKRQQPSTFKLVDTVILCGSLEVPGKIQMGEKEEKELGIFLEKARFEPKKNLTVSSQSFTNPFTRLFNS